MKEELLCKLIKTCDNKFNGHNLLHINSPVWFTDIMSLVKELNGQLTANDEGHIVAEFDDEYNGTIVHKYFWDKDEHPSGHRDKILLSWGINNE